MLRLAVTFIILPLIVRCDIPTCPLLNLTSLTVSGSRPGSDVFRLSHPFLDTASGLFPDINYTVVVRLRSNLKQKEVLVTTLPTGTFSSLPNFSTDCGQHSVAFSADHQLIKLSWTFTGLAEQNVTFLLFVKNSHLRLVASLEVPWRPGCLQVISRSAGFLTFNSSCSVFIQSPGGSPITLLLGRNSVPEGSEMSVASGRTETEDAEKVMSSADNESRLISKGPFLLLTSRGQAGVHFIYSSIGLLGCNSRSNLSEGIITSPNYPQLYRHSIDCHYHVDPPGNHNTSLVLVQFLELNLQNAPCDKNHLVLSSGWTGQLCGNQIRVVVSEAPLHVHFHSEKVNEGHGFAAAFRVVPRCRNITSSMPAATLCTRDYPHAFLDQPCTISVHVPLGYRLEVNWTGLTCGSNNTAIANEGGREFELCSSNFSSASEMRTTGNSLVLRLQAKSDIGSDLCLSYRVASANNSLTACSYGWISGKLQCYLVSSVKLNWTQAEQHCQSLGGHLASITEEEVSDLMDQILTYSAPDLQGESFWIGGNDRRYENCYEWTDGQPFSYTNWFQGWEKHGGYSGQPSDDGLSDQDCLELRNVFRFPSKGDSRTSRYYWNDRGCYVDNSFICQRLRPGIVIEPSEDPECNATIVLTSEKSRDVLTSPGYPAYYPNNKECHYVIQAPPGQRIEMVFTDFVLEENSKCEYDRLEISPEGGEKFQMHCGDWNNRMKLLRHVTPENLVHLKFTSDFSHSYKGFRLEVFIHDEKHQETLCGSKSFSHHQGKCYLFGSYPEVSWSTARRICAEWQAELAVRPTADEQRFWDLLIKGMDMYSSATYWLGGRKGHTGWRWSDDTQMTPTDKRRLTTSDATGHPAGESCLAFEWRQQNNGSNYYWTPKICDQPGRYICQKDAIVIANDLNKTVTEKFGTVTSVGYPLHYVNNLHYTVTIKGPPTVRVIITFSQLELEWQEQCLYDYVALQSTADEPPLRMCSLNNVSRDSYHFISYSNEVFLTFHSDYSITGPGFVATWEMVTVDPCEAVEMTMVTPTHLTSALYPRGYPPHLQCLTMLTAPPGQKVLLTVHDVEIGQGRRADGKCDGDYLRIHLDDRRSVDLCGNSSLAPSGLQFMSYGETIKLEFHSAKMLDGGGRRGFNVTCEPWSGHNLQGMIFPNSQSQLTSLNYPHTPPQGVNHTIKIVVPVGDYISLTTSGRMQHDTSDCESSVVTVVEDKYTTGGHWKLCPESNSVAFRKVVLSSFYNTLYAKALVKTKNATGPVFIAALKTVTDINFKSKSLLSGIDVDSCEPSPCQNQGECLRTDSETNQCQCAHPYTGIFCHLTLCDLQPCNPHGICNLTSDGYSCDCATGFTGSFCNETVTPCLPHPCGLHGDCKVANDTNFICQCHVWYEGPTCGRYVFRLPYKPLSERMLEEPFWLGLITVSAVLLLILLVYCIKRKFADKIEKLLAEEIEKSKNNPSPPTTRYSFSSNPPSLTPASLSPQSCHKSFFSRIRKQSLRSGTGGSNSPTEKDASRAFSFDDILRRTSSKRSGIGGGPNLGSEGGGCKDEETSRILASLVTSSSSTPKQRRMSLDEFFRLSERKIQRKSSQRDDDDDPDEDPAVDAGCGLMETSFMGRLTPFLTRHSAPSFTDFHSIREQSVEQTSSSDSLIYEPRTSEIKVEISPSPKHSSSPGSSSTVEEDSEMNREYPNPPQISIIIEDDVIQRLSPKMDDSDRRHSIACIGETSTGCTFLEVPRTYCAAPQVDASEVTILNLPKQVHPPGSPKNKKLDHPRKYSVELTTPKILITTNMSSIDSDENSPPRTPNPNKTMSYLSPLTIICSAADRTISESNLSTSGYSSLSSPGMSRCNSSSPLADEIEGMTKKRVPFPNMLSPSYLVTKADKFHFSNKLEVPHQTETVLSLQRRGSDGAPWFVPRKGTGTPVKERFPAAQRANSYQTTSTEDSIDDEGIVVDPIDIKIRRGDLKSAKELELYMTLKRFEESIDVPNVTITPPKSPSGNSSPKCLSNRTDRSKKHSDKHRRSPIGSPLASPGHDSSEIRIPRNASRTSMLSKVMSSSDTDDPDMAMSPRLKSQAKRPPRKHDGVQGLSVRQRSSEALPDIATSVVECPPSVTRTSSSESIPSTTEDARNTDYSTDGEKRPSHEGSHATVIINDLAFCDEPNIESWERRKCEWTAYRAKTDPTAELRKLACGADSSSRQVGIHGQRSFPLSARRLEWLKSLDSVESSIPSDSDDDRAGHVPQTPRIPLLRITSDPQHPSLRRQEALPENDSSDDSISETTVLLRKNPYGNNLPITTSASASSLKEPETNLTGN